MLAWFRRHALILMVFLGSAAMVIFGLGSVFDSFARSVGQKSYENPVLASWKGGSLTQDDVSGLYQRHAESHRFLVALVGAAEKKAGDTVRPLAPIIVPIQAQSTEQQNNQVIDRILLAQAAKDQGMVVSDGMIRDYITMVSSDAGFSDQDLYKINREVNQTSLDIVKEHLKFELLAMQMSRLTQVGMSLIPNPTEAMSLYARTAEKIECEVIPFAVSDYVSKVTAKPSDSELRELYSEGKAKFADPRGEEPGFKIPQKINVQYFVADEATFIQNEMNAITDEEVQAEYDRLVAKKDIMVIVPKEIDNSFVLPGLETDPPPALPTETDPANDSDAPAPPSDVDAPPMDESSDAPANETAAEKTAPAKAETVETEKPETEKPETEKPEAKKLEKNQGDDTKKGDAGESGDQSSLVVNSTRSQRVSFQEETKEQSGQVKQETAETAAAPAETAAATAPAATPAAPALQLGGAAQEVGGIGSDLEAELNKPEEITEFKPLKDVAENIRRSLALPKAGEKMGKAINEAQLEVGDYFAVLQDWEDEGKKGDEPTVDFEAIAKDYKLSLRQTGLMTMAEMSKDPFGGLNLGFSTISEYIFFFSNKRKLFEPQPLNGAAASLPNSYVYWLTENEEPREPTFDESVEQIKEFWFNQKAFEMAQKEAEALKAKVNAAKESKLSELYTDKALPTGQFSWFDSQRGNSLSMPGNVDSPSDEFMETAFSLAPLEAGVAVDASRETVYVVQSINGPRQMNEVGQDFLENQFMKFQMVPYDVQRAASYYSGSEQQKANESLRENQGFEMKN